MAAGIDRVTADERVSELIATVPAAYRPRGAFRPYHPFRPYCGLSSAEA
jgi:hypothetical protein